MRRETETGQPGRRRDFWKPALLVTGVLITALLASTAFFDWHLHGGAPLLTPRFSPREFLHALGSNLDWLVAFLLLSTSMLPLRALQWQRTLPRKVPFSERWHFVNIGAAVQNLLPGNLGDITRAFLLARTQKLPVVVGLGSVAVCKLLELAALVLLAASALSLPYWGRIPQLSHALGIAAWLFVGLATLVVLLARYSLPVARRLQRADALPKVQTALAQVDAGLGTARSPKGMLVALLFSIPPNLAAAVGYGIGLQAIGVKHGLFAGPIVLGLIALGQGTPGIAPGPGMYLLVTSWAARSLGAPAEDAAAFALLTNVATGVSHWVPGLISLMLRRVRWSELKQETSLAKHAAKQAARIGEGDERVPAEM